MAWTVKISLRNAHSKEERKLKGRCISAGNAASVYLNVNQHSSELFNTYIHELTHAYIHRLPTSITYASQEAIAEAVGKAAEEVFNKYFKLK